MYRDGVWGKIAQDFLLFHDHHMCAHSTIYICDIYHSFVLHDDGNASVVSCHGECNFNKFDRLSLFAPNLTVAPLVSGKHCSCLPSLIGQHCRLVCRTWPLMVATLLWKASKKAALAADTGFTQHLYLFTARQPDLRRRNFWIEPHVNIS